MSPISQRGASKRCPGGRITEGWQMIQKRDIKRTAVKKQRFFYWQLCKINIQDSTAIILLHGGNKGDAKKYSVPFSRLYCNHSEQKMQAFSLLGIYSCKAMSQVRACSHLATDARVRYPVGICPYGFWCCNCKCTVLVIGYILKD